MNELLRHHALRALGLSSLLCERPLSTDRTVPSAIGRRAVQVRGGASGTVPIGFGQREVGECDAGWDSKDEAERPDLHAETASWTASIDAGGRVLAIELLALLVRTYGVDTVERWLRNIKAIREAPSPGTITDPRR